VRAAWREAAWIAAGQAVAALGAIVGVRLLTELMAPDSYGQFALGLTIATLITQVILGPLANGFERYFAPAHETGQLRAYFGAMSGLTLRASVLILIFGAFAGAALLLIGRAEWLVLALAAVLFAMLSGWEAILDGVQNAARQRHWVALHQALRHWLRPIAAAVLLTTFAATSSASMVGFVLSSVVVLCSQSWLLKRTMRTMDLTLTDAPRPALTREMLAYATPFSVWGLFTWLQGSSDRWALQALGTAAQVGLFAIVSQLGSYPLNLVGSMITQLAAPIMFARVGAGGNAARTRSAARLCALLAVGMLTATALIAGTAALAYRQIFELLVGPEFRSFSYLLPIAILAAGLFNTGQIVSLVPLALGDSRALLAPKVGTALLAVILNAAGAYLFGIPGVLAASLLFGSSYLVWVVWVGFSTLKLHAHRPALLGLARAEP
jgi:O-antigen/teichoic acid export membrane protein